MNADKARRIVAAMGLTDHVRALVDATPPLTVDQVERVRRIFTKNMTKAGPCDEDRPSGDPDPARTEDRHGS